jgi:hypothetical protein
MPYQIDDSLIRKLSIDPSTKELQTPMSLALEPKEMSANNPAPASSASEASILPRVVTLLTPVFAIAAAVVAGWIGKATGAVVDQGQITVLMSLAATSALTAAWKWMQGWQQHERLVALGSDVPKKKGPVTING